MKFLGSICLILSIFLGLPQMADAQANLKGTVKDPQGEPLSYAHIALKGTSKGTTTDESGFYQFQQLEPGTYSIKATFTGYVTKTDSITITPSSKIVNANFTLPEKTYDLGEMVVTGTMKPQSVKSSPVKVTVLNTNFFDQNPAGNFMENVNRIDGVQQQMNCGVCGTNSIRINGMEGPYTLVLIDGMPIMSNLASVYAFNGIPGSLIDQVEVVKGPNSTLYGSEAMGGVINIRTKSPENSPLMSVNGQYTSHREFNSDVSYSQSLGDDVHTLFSANYFHNDQKWDFNNDNFMDVILKDRVSLFNKWQFDRSKDRKANIAARYYYEFRNGGTMQFDPSLRGSDSIYGESILTKRFEVMGTYELPFDAENIKLDFSYNQHAQNSYYGTEHYVADQSTGFANLIWEKALGNHQLLGGLTGRYENYRDNSPAETDQQTFVPGIFLQDEWTLDEQWTLLSGMRMDRHEAHGKILSPRLNLHYKVDEWTTARLNMGTGFRQVHLFTEDHAALTGARDVVIREDLQPERSYNAVFNLNHVYQVDQGGSGTLDLDLFYNHFTNKIIPNYDQNPNEIVYENLKGHGITRGASVSIGHSFEMPLRVKMGATYQEAFEVRNAGGENKIRKPIVLTPRFTGNFTLDYEFKGSGTSVIYTGQLTGPQNLPKFEPPFSRPKKSELFSMQNLKVSQKLGHNVELYGGVKNLLNWTQPTPIIDPENPFGENFDTIYAYGPLQPRRFYLGLKWHLDKMKGS